MQFVIVEPDPIVAMDLSATLTERFPNAPALFASSLEEASGLTLDPARPIVLIAEEPRAALIQAGIVGKIRAQGGWIMSTLDYDTSTNDRDGDPTEILHVPKPFSTHMILDALANAGVA